jgi:hypothetical protein
MATPLWLRHHRVSAMSFGVTVKQVNPNAFAPKGKITR